MMVIFQVKVPNANGEFDENDLQAPLPAGAAFLNGKTSSHVNNRIHVSFQSTCKMLPRFSFLLFFSSSL